MPASSTRVTGGNEWRAAHFQGKSTQEDNRDGQRDANRDGGAGGTLEVDEQKAKG